MLYDFGDGLSKFVTYPGAFNFTVIVSIDSNTVFSGKNVLNPNPFFIETIVSIKNGLITSNKVNHTLNTGLIPLHTRGNFSWI